MDYDMTSLSFQDTQHAIVDLMPDLRRFALKLTRSADAAEDLVQTAYMRAFNHPTPLASLAQAAKWMRSIIMNLWIDERRSAHYRLSEPLEDNNYHVANEDVECTVIARTTLARVQTEMATMPENLRSVIMLICVEDLSYKQAAAELGIPIGTVMSRLYRGRMELVRRISD
jgi:RNA polymerase sigma-70 factor (ECF subfamily)